MPTKIYGIWVDERTHAYTLSTVFATLKQAQDFLEENYDLVQKMERRSLRDEYVANERIYVESVQNPYDMANEPEYHIIDVKFIIFSQNTPPSRNVVSREGMNAHPIILPVLIC